MRGSRPGFWKQYEVSQLSIAGACMANTKKRATVRPAAVTTNPVATRLTAAVPVATRVFVVGPIVGTLNGRRVFHP
jgi:predicted nucleotide-binding protein